jgi:hypothetical protein
MGYDYMKLEDQVIVLTRDRDSKVMKLNNTSLVNLDPSKRYTIAEMYQEIRSKL